MKMEKTPRYTQRERNMVLGFAAQHKDVIENKRTDAESNRKKDEVWRQIAKEFNGRVYHQRSSKQLRQLYKNMKLLLKKDLCGEGKGNRSFMDLLNTLSQQDSVSQYIAQQMSPSYSNSRHQKFDDDFDDSKLPTLNYEGIDNDVIVIKSEDISDNENSQNAMDEDDDDDNCLSPKDIPEVCLEEEDDNVFATDLRQTHNQRQQQQQQQQTSPQHQQQPEITIQNIGGIRVGSIGSLANLKAIQNGGNNSALSVAQVISGGGNINNSSTNNNHNNNNNNNNGNNNSTNSNNNSNTNRQLSAEQRHISKQLLLDGLGLSEVHPTDSPLPALQRATHNHYQHHSSSNTNVSGTNINNNNNASSNNNNNNNSTNQLLFNLTGSSYGQKHTHAHNPNYHNTHSNGHSLNSHIHHNSNNTNNSSSSNSNSNNNNKGNDYIMSLAIEERKRKIDLLNAQIEYWKTLTKKLDANGTHQPTPACLCHFPGKVNGLQAHNTTS